MRVEMMNELAGKPLLAQDGYEIYGTYVEGRLIVTGVYASDPQPLQEVRIPPFIGGVKVRGVAGHFCGNEFETFSIGTLYIPDSVERVNLKMMKPGQLLLTPTDTPALRLVNGLLLSGDGRVVLTNADESLTRYVVPDGVEKIGAKAFCFCRAEEIVLPESLRVIGESAFFASRLRRISFPAGLKTIEKSAFERSSLEEVVLPHGLEQLGERAFARCNLRMVRVPGTVKRIPWSAFDACDRLTEVELAPGVQEIGNYAFEGCSALKKVTLSQGLKRIGTAAFAEALLEDVVLPEGVECLGDNAFAGSLLCTLHLPDSLLEVGVDVVKDCWRLKNVRLPEGMERLPESAEGCEKDMMTADDDLDSFFSDSVPVLETEAYTVYGSISSCTATDNCVQIDTVKVKDGDFVAEVRIPASVADCVVEVVGNGWNVPKARIGRLILPGSVCHIDHQWLECVDELMMESGEEDAYIIEEGFLMTRDRKTLVQQLRWQDAAVSVPEGVEEIAMGAFSDCMVEEITFPASVERMGKRAFEASALRWISLPEGLRTLGRGAFESCRQLCKVRLNSGLQELPAEAFRDCAALESVMTPHGLERIGDGAFRGCRALTALTLPETLRSLGHDALIDTGLTALHIPAALTQVHVLVFQGMKLTVAQDHPLFMAEDGSLYSKDGETLLRWGGAEEAIVPVHVKRVATHAFSHCRDLKRVVLPRGLTKLEQFTFDDCSSLECVEIPEGVKRIGAGCFDSCCSLKEMRLSDGVEEIGERCFAACRRLEYLHVPQSVQHIGKRAFAHCADLWKLMLPDDLVWQEDGSYAKFTGAANGKEGEV